jgi:hypothetical protein
MGLTVVGLGLLDIAIWWIILNAFVDIEGTQKLVFITTTMLTFGMGASTQALFARVGGGIAVQPQKEVVQNEQSAGADLHDAQPLGRLELEGQDDESHSDQTPDLTQNEQKCHSGLLFGGLAFIIAQSGRFVKGKLPKIPPPH